MKRRLQRGLRDGNSITVTREWRVGFARQNRGIAVSGSQISVQVEAPENLAPIAKIEEQRSTNSMFPILLDSMGRVAAAGQNTTQESFEKAVEAGMQMLSDVDGAPALYRPYMAQMQKAGSTLLDDLPADLFYPSTEPFHAVRQIALPDGGFGEFEAHWTASVQDSTGLLSKAHREVITRVGESERRSSEDWSLEMG